MSNPDPDSRVLERSFRQRLFYTTPMRDLIRARVTGRLDLTIYPERAGLPPAISALVVRVTRRTRLRVMEKIDVARELTAHFSEGIAVGKAPDELIEEFGSVNDAARLIRRAKKRNRSRVLRAVKRTTAGVLAAIALLYVGVLVWYLADSGKVNPSHDYLADLNAVAAAVPERDRAWPVYRGAFIALGEIPRNVSDCKGPNDYRWGETVAFIESHQTEIEQIRMAAAMPGLGYIVDTRFHDADRPLMDPNGTAGIGWGADGAATVVPSLQVLMPQIGRLRMAARLLRFDALRRLQSGTAGDSNAVITDIEAIVGAAHHSNEHPSLISQLVRTNIYTVAVETAQNLLQASGDTLTDDELVRLDRLFDPSITGDCCAVSMDGERLSLKDLVQHTYTDNGDGNGILRPGKMDQVWGVAGWGKSHTSDAPFLIAAPISAVMPDRKAFLDQGMLRYDLSEQEGAIPMWERDGGELDWFDEYTEKSTLGNFRWSHLHMMIPAFQRAYFNADVAAINQVALHATIALHRYRIAHGQWPTDLGSMVPVYLETLPIDRFDGEPLRYQIGIDGEPILYSIGSDYYDNGGAIGRDEDGWPSNQAHWHWHPRPTAEALGSALQDGDASDFILWPPLPAKPVEADPYASDL